MNRKKKAHLAWQRSIARGIRSEARKLINAEKKEAATTRVIMKEVIALNEWACERARESVRAIGIKRARLNEYLQMSDKRLFQAFWGYDWMNDFYNC